MGEPRAWYNEHDPFAAAWLRELIADGHIAAGDVDERSITDVQPSDLAGYVQCHFFAGIGVWSYALRQSGWADATPVWTGSCPCQSFSASGKRGGFSDPRHLWPAWYRLLRERRPDVCFGEQVASRDGLAWFDVVSADLEGAGYAVGAADLCAASVGAPHIRQRLYFVADSSERGRAELGTPRVHDQGERGDDASGRRAAGGVADAGHQRRRADATGREARCRAEDAGQLVNATSGGCGERGDATRAGDRAILTDFWSDVEWIACTDGKHRAVPGAQPALFPLAPRTPGRVGLLRGAGNALCSEQAKVFIQAYLEVRRSDRAYALMSQGPVS